jgi:hypothetical protein
MPPERQRSDLERAVDVSSDRTSVTALLFFE